MPCLVYKRVLKDYSGFRKRNGREHEKERLFRRLWLWFGQESIKAWGRVKQSWREADGRTFMK